MPDDRIHVSPEIEETRPRAPWESVLLAYAAMAPILGGAIAYLLMRRGAADLVVHLTIIWSGSILCFLAGVRRGLSFRQPGGPLLTQLIAMLWLFVLGVGSLLIPWAPVSLALQIIGYATMAVYDPVAAYEGEAPRYFERLRPAQMTIPIVSLALILAGLVA